MFQFRRISYPICMQTFASIETGLDTPARSTQWVLLTEADFQRAVFFNCASLAQSEDCSWPTTPQGLQRGWSKWSKISWLLKNIKYQNWQSIELDRQTDMWLNHEIPLEGEGERTGKRHTEKAWKKYIACFNFLLLLETTGVAEGCYSSISQQRVRL